MGKLEQEPEKRREQLAGEIQRRRKAATVSKQESQKRKLEHLTASDEALYGLLKNDE